MDTIFLRKGKIFSTYLEEAHGEKNIIKLIALRQLKNRKNYFKIVKQLRSEKDILNYLNNKGIKYVPLLLDGGANYVKLSFIEGEVLSDKLLERLSIKEKNDIVIRLEEVIRDIHSFNIVHGDIKPSNVIYTPEKDVYLIDFGSAAFQGETTFYTSYSKNYSSNNVMENGKRQLNDDYYSFEKLKKKLRSNQ